MISAHSLLNYLKLRPFLLTAYFRYSFDNCLIWSSVKLVMVMS